MWPSQSGKLGLKVQQYSLVSGKTPVVAVRTFTLSRCFTTSVVEPHGILKFHSTALAKHQLFFYLLTYDLVCWVQDLRMGFRLTD